MAKPLRSDASRATAATWSVMSTNCGPLVVRTVTVRVTHFIVCTPSPAAGGRHTIHGILPHQGAGVDPGGEKMGALAAPAVDRIRGREVEGAVRTDRHIPTAGQTCVLDAVDVVEGRSHLDVLEHAAVVGATQQGVLGDARGR